MTSCIKLNNSHLLRRKKNRWEFGYSDLIQSEGISVHHMWTTIYTRPSQWVSTLVKELTTTTRVMQSYSNELSPLVSNSTNINKQKLMHMPYKSWADVCRRNDWAVKYHVKRKVRQVSISAWSVLRVQPHWRIVIQRNSLSVYDNIYIYIYIRLTRRLITWNSKSWEIF